MKITLIAGARPNFMKIAPIIHAIEKYSKNQDLSYRLIHTGQHYDEKMSKVFFEDLNIKTPDINLEVGSGSHAVQTAQIMIKFEQELIENPTDVVLVVGDVNSTLACSVVAKKLNTQLVHVEAGIRSFDLTMPEEINRMVTDALSDHFFTTSEYANSNLKNAGISDDRIHFVGNVMIDTLLTNKNRFTANSKWNELNLKPQSYWLLTLHRPSNVDDANKLKSILSLIAEHSGELPIIFPIHPRTLQIFKQLPESVISKFILLEPMRYLEFMYFVQNAKAVITDSGGIQEETTVLSIPCMTIRENTERPETVSIGSNVLVKNISTLPSHMKDVINNTWKKSSIPNMWDGKTSERIIQKLIKLYS
jgi:UDP-N-acetylglucosamine 2-epimerase (non-hydrolysing)